MHNQVNPTDYCWNRPTEETVKNAFYGRPLLTLEFPPRTYSTFSRVENARSSTRHSLRRRPPFFPAICALRIYGRTFVCRPQYMGDVIIVIRGLPPRTWTAAWHWRAHSSDIFRQSKTFQRFPPAGGKSFHVAPLQKMQKFFVRKWEIVRRGRLFSGHRWDSSRLNAAVAAAFRQKDKFLRVFDGTVDVVSNDYAHETWIDDRHPVGDPSNN